MNINTRIAKKYIISNKRLTSVAVLGVLLGMSIYIFMNSMLVGFDKTSNTSIFKSTSHIRVFKDDEISRPLLDSNQSQPLILNPKVVPKKNTIINPNLVIETIQKMETVEVVTPQVTTSIFYTNGKSQIAGIATGTKPDEANKMYNIQSFMVVGNFDQLKNNPNGIIIGSGIAEKMNLNIGDNMNLTSSKAVNRTFQVIGIFKTNNSITDKTKSYIHISAAQQLLRESNSYITDINVNISDPEKASEMAKKIAMLTGYNAEGWKEANETMMAANKMRKIVITFVSLTILLVAGFGIYNILNMTVSQKINDIAILKAIGFKGKDVIRIFVTQAVTIGILGVIGGMLMATILITFLKTVYIGGDIGYFPIDYEPTKFIQGVLIGLFITFWAGYIPARKAAKVDPVDILRK
jgi:lipoprotein-releasing system permease protein